MPEPYQLAIAHYMAVDGEAWEDLLDLPSWPASKDAIKTALIAALPRYVADYGDCRYGVLTIATQALKDAIMQDEEIAQDFADWDAYHAWYVANCDTPEHPATDRWPAVLSGFESETLQDGHHRIHSYVRSGHADIPLVFYPTNIHMARFQQQPRAESYV